MLNRVVLTGRLTRDAELRYTQGGTSVASFTLAVDRQFRNAQGERDADFINCVIWRKPAENFANFTHKGALVGIDGSLRTRSYENNQGQRVYVTEVQVDNCWNRVAMAVSPTVAVVLSQTLAMVKATGTTISHSIMAVAISKALTTVVLLNQWEIHHLAIKADSTIPLKMHQCLVKKHQSTMIFHSAMKILSQLHHQTMMPLRLI